MKTLYFFIMLLLTATSEYSKAQDVLPFNIKGPTDFPVHITRSHTAVATMITIDGKQQSISNPIVMVDSFETDLQALLIEPKNIDRVEVLKDSNAVKMFGEKGKNGVILIYTKEGTVFKKLTDYVNGGGKAKNITNVKINDVILKDPSHLLIDQSYGASITHEVDYILDETTCIPTLRNTVIIITQKQ